MGMGRKTGVGRNPNQRCGPCNFITDPVQHAPLDASGGRRYPFPIFWSDHDTFVDFSFHAHRLPFGLGPISKGSGKIQRHVSETCWTHSI